MKHEIIDRFRGCIYGQAIGDALGLGTEFMCDEDIALRYPNGLRHYDQIFQKRWKIGDWTDDTDMMLCIADAVIEDKDVNFLNIARHFKNWAEGMPMGIGSHTYKVLTIGDYAEKPFEVSYMAWKMSRYQSAANGGLMRTSVVGLFPRETTACAEKICQLTHYDPRCVGSCVIVSELIHALVYGIEPPTRYKMKAPSPSPSPVGRGVTTMLWFRLLCRSMRICESLLLAMTTRISMSFVVQTRSLCIS